MKNCRRALGILALALMSPFACGARSPSPTSIVGKGNASSEGAAGQGAAGLKKKDLVYADRVAWRGQLKWPRDCEESFDYPDKSLAGLEFFELSAAHYLVQVTCTLGAYQGSYVYLLLDESGSTSTSKLLSFVNWVDSGEPNRLRKVKATELTGTPDFDADKKLLRLTNKFRGIGDCGFLATYSFTKERPEVVSLQDKLQCDGTKTDPRSWKQVSPD